MEIISTVALISINETLLVQLFSFLIFLFLINRVMFRPLRKNMDSRADYIQNLEKEIATAGDEIQAIREKIRQGESDNRSEAQRLRRRLESETGRDVDAIQRTGAEAVRRLRQTASEDLGRLLAEAREQLQTESETIAVELMSSILERKVSQ
jgi:F-type H+-transporting ATPase subunit b